MSDFRSLISQLEGMNAALASTNVVRKPADDDEKPKKKSLVLCSQHQDQVKATAERYGWTIVEFEELFGQAKFEKDGNQIEFEWNEEGRTSNRFQINIWDDADTGLRTILNARMEQLQQIFERPESFGEMLDVAKLHPRDLEI